MTASPTIRPARLDERSALEALIARSARALSVGDYDEAQLDRAIGTVFGVDTELVEDGTYLVAEIGGVLAGCGGWSRRKTLFGADGRRDREPGFLDPAVDAAKIRAFFVAPEWARRGVGTAILDACEAAARAAGFKALELMATLPGERMYRALGFKGSDPIEYDMGEGRMIRFVPMRKDLE
ncbi:MAG: GNAT family N-acetyltransferase [Proteobacteria bacterium]|nr:GNAT family N-acetyltransferase [Pseudomonadota bacterium]